MKNVTTSLTVDQYIKGQPEAHQATLEKMRSIIREAVPSATEAISYQVPVFKTSHMVVGFGVTRNFCSLYTMNPELVVAMKEELKGIKYSGSTLHFEPGKRLPVALIKKIVRTRVKENNERYKQK
jgi:uncharacterized protein YdhG (YjbR/CyaY superfamily)